MPILLRREAVAEDVGQIFGGDADAIVPHGDATASALGIDGHGDAWIRPSGILGSVLRVAQEIDEDLQDLVFVHPHRWRGVKVAHDLDAVAGEARGVDPQRILDEALG